MQRFQLYRQQAMRRARPARIDPEQFAQSLNIVINKIGVHAFIVSTKYQFDKTSHGC